MSKFTTLILAISIFSLMACDGDRAFLTVDDCDLRPGTVCRDSDLSGLDLRFIDLSGSDLRGSDLSETDLTSTNLTGSNLSNTTLRGATLNGTNCTGANLEGADLTDAKAANTIWQDTVCPDGRNSSDLEGTCLNNLDLADPEPDVVPEPEMAPDMEPDMEPEMDPTAVCGNEVCEEGESAESCPQDCPTGCDEPNDCGGCGSLEGELGATCGTCGLGEFVCEGEEALVCEGAQEGVNACGGCQDLELQPESPCGPCMLGTLRCEGEDATVCDAVCGAQCEENEDCPGGVCSNGSCAPQGFAFIPPGTFTMGAPEGESNIVFDDFFVFDEVEHEVTLTRSIAMSAFEVTAGDFMSLLEGAPSAFDFNLNFPVENVTFATALAYTNALSELHGLAPCYSLGQCTGEAPEGALDCSEIIVNAPEGNPYLCEGYRLPTEAEWEYSTRAGTQTAFFTGDITAHRCDPLDPSLDSAGFYCGNAGRRPHQVGLKAPNAFGLYDVHGNVREWVWDHYAHYDEAPQIDPFGPLREEERIIRGGSWDDDAQDCRSALRLSAFPNEASATLGFRVAITIE